MFVHCYLLWISAWANFGGSKEIFDAFSVGNTIEIEELKAEVSKNMKVCKFKCYAIDIIFITKIFILHCNVITNSTYQVTIS